MVYIEAMQISLEKKLGVLNKLLDLTEDQAELLKKDELDDVAFTGIVDKKAVLIEELTKLDEGFEKMYENIKEEMKKDPAAHKEQIKALQELISKVTEVGVKLEATERRNKEKMDLFLKTSRNKIKTFNKSNSAVSRYYKNAAAPVTGESFFMDKKK